MPQNWSLTLMMPLLVVALQASAVGPGGACVTWADCGPYSDCVNGFCCGTGTTYGQFTNCTDGGVGSGGNTQDCCANNSAALVCTGDRGQGMCCLSHGAGPCLSDEDCCDNVNRVYVTGDRCFGNPVKTCATCSVDQTPPQGTTGNWNAASCCNKNFVTKDGGSPAICCSPLDWLCSTDYDCCANAGISDAGALPVVCGAVGDLKHGLCCIPVGSTTNCSANPSDCCSGSCNPSTHHCECQ
jgi:hypothetical protein